MIYLTYRVLDLVAHRLKSRCVTTQLRGLFFVILTMSLFHSQAKSNTKP